MQVIHNLELYRDMMGNPVTTPVLQVGSGAPHVVMVALQHGWELIGLDTGLQVMRNCNPTGTITLVSVANPLAFQDAARLTATGLDPQSRQTTNLNRVHPGRHDGNIAERSAWAIDQYIQSLEPDAVIDLHAYAHQSIPHAIVDACAPKLHRQITNWMNRSKVAWYQEYEGEDFTAQALDGALSAIWVGRGIPSITVEHGPLRTFSPQQAAAAQQTLTNILSAFGAIDSEIVDAVPAVLKNQLWQRTEIVYQGPAGGYLRPLVSICEAVQQNQALADVVVPTGEIVDQVRAPSTGVHFIWHDEYRVMPGSPVGVMLIPY